MSTTRLHLTIFGTLIATLTEEAAANQDRGRIGPDPAMLPQRFPWICPRGCLRWAGRIGTNPAKDEHGVQ